MSETICQWPVKSYQIQPNTLKAENFADSVYERVCRVDFTQPGFCLVDAGTEIDSAGFRRLMVDLKCAMSAIHERRCEQTLVFLSAARFDQQNSTKPHLDGGPEESLLMLGYEPSQIESEIEISDYVRCAVDIGLSSTEFLAQHNPMFKLGFEKLRPYATTLTCFNPTRFQILLINNSSASNDGRSWLGTLHTATILNPDESKRRVINSTMLTTAPVNTADAVSETALHEFMTTSQVRRRGYDKLDVDDDK